MFSWLSETVELPAVLVALLGLLVVLLILFIYSIKRHRDPTLQIKTDQSIDKVVGGLAGMSQGALIEGNSLELFENEAFFDVLFEELRGAQRTLHFETFLWKDGELARRVVEVLCERARAGVTVRLLVDDRGGRKMGEQAPRRFEEAGVRLVRHHPARLRHIGVLNERDHRKLVVVDGRVALIGGHCITDEWFHGAPGGGSFRDLSVRVSGPAVGALQAVFAENWLADTGEMFVGDDAFPELPRAGDVTLHVANVKVEGSPPAVKVLHHLALCLARKRLWIQNPYFLPDIEAVQAFADAVKRGVDVRIMVPSARASDASFVQHAAHYHFGTLLRDGVRIFQYPKTLLHQKVMMVDGVWSAIGSSNFDDRSFEINDEVTIGVNSPAFTRELEAVFERDMQACTELQATRWAQRSWTHKLKDRALYAFNELM